MPPTDPDFSVSVQARFTVTLPNGTTFSDAIVMPRSEFDGMTNAQLRALRQQRVANHLKNLQDAQNAPLPTQAQLRAERMARRNFFREQLEQVEIEIASEGG